MRLLAAAIASLSLIGSSSAQTEGTKTQEDMRMVAQALEKYTQGTLLGDVLETRRPLSA